MHYNVLLDEDNNLIPIQWKGYDAKMRRYQGEILYKGEIKNRFEVKLKNCESNRNLIDNYDWSGMHAIIDTIRIAFHSVDADNILGSDLLY